MTPRRGPAIAALLLAGAVAACISPTAATPSPSSTAAMQPPVTGSPAPSVTPAARPPAPAPTPTAIPASSSTPSPVAAADLIVRLDVCNDVCPVPNRVRFEYLADGRVISQDLETGRLQERRLTPAGLSRVEARVAEDADLLARDLNVVPVTAHGKQWPAHGVGTYTFIAPGDTGGRATVTTVTSGSLDPGYFVPDERIDRLTSLGDALLAPETLAGTDGWADPAWSPYVPRKAVVLVFARDGVAPFSSPGVGATGWPFGEDPQTFGEPVALSGATGWPVTRCDVLDATAANDAAASLPAGVLRSDSTLFWRTGTMAWAERALELLVSLRGLLPDEAAQTPGDVCLVW